MSENIKQFLHFVSCLSLEWCLNHIRSHINTLITIVLGNFFDFVVGSVSWPEISVEIGPIKNFLSLGYNCIVKITCKVLDDFILALSIFFLLQRGHRFWHRITNCYTSSFSQKEISIVSWSISIQNRIITKAFLSILWSLQSHFCESSWLVIAISAHFTFVDIESLSIFVIGLQIGILSCYKVCSKWFWLNWWASVMHWHSSARNFILLIIPHLSLY